MTASIYYDPDYASDGDQTLYMTKRFYALGQYSRFVQPGAVRYGVSGSPSGVQRWRSGITASGSSSRPTPTPWPRACSLNLGSGTITSLSALPDRREREPREHLGADHLRLYDLRVAARAERHQLCTQQLRRPRRGRRPGTGREPVGQVPRRPQRLHHQRHPARNLDLQRRQQPGVRAHVQRRDHRLRRQVPGGLRAGQDSGHHRRHQRLHRRRQPAVAGPSRRQHHQRRVGPLPRRLWAGHLQRHRRRHLHLQRRRQPAVDPGLIRRQG